MTRFHMTQADYDAVVALESATTDKKIRRRLQVLILRYEGLNTRKIAERLGLLPTSVRAMCARYMREGLEEYSKNKYAMRNRLLSVEREAEILNGFEAQAAAGSLLNVKDIKAALDRECGKNTGNVYVYLVLKRHQWIKERPQAETGDGDMQFVGKSYWKPSKQSAAQ